MESLSKQELVALLGAAKAKRTRDWLMILVAYSHGLRASEVTSIVRDDIEDGHLEVQRLKGSLRTIQPLVEDDNPLLNEHTALVEYSNTLLNNQRLFPLTRQRFWQIVREHGKTAGLPIRKLHPHVLKSSIAMHTIHLAGIENVRQYLGHKSISSTGAYLKVTDADSSAAIALAKKGSQL